MSETEEEDPTTGLDVICINYRTPGDLQEFIESFIEFTPETPCKFTVVNVQPDYDSYRIGEFCRNSGLTHIWHNDNIGFGKAVNHAAARTKRDVLAIFNADTRFTSNILDECYDALTANEDWAVLGPRQVNEQGLITSGGVGGTQSQPHLRFWQEPDVGQATGIEEVVSVSGSAYIIKREAWDKITKVYQTVNPVATGALLESRHYYEEEFCSYVGRSLGYKIYFYGACSLIHKWHQASELGSEVDQKVGEARELFRTTCDRLGIEHG